MKLFKVKFIMGKSRVSPTRIMTMPNLELQAAAYAAQLPQIVIEEHDNQINENFFAPTVQNFSVGSETRRYVIAYLLLTG